MTGLPAAEHLARYWRQDNGTSATDLLDDLASILLDGAFLNVSKYPLEEPDIMDEPDGETCGRCEQFETLVATDEVFGDVCADCLAIIEAGEAQVDLALNEEKEGE